MEHIGLHAANKFASVMEVAQSRKVQSPCPPPLVRPKGWRFVKVVMPSLLDVDNSICSDRTTNRGLLVCCYGSTGSCSRTCQASSQPLVQGGRVGTLAEPARFAGYWRLGLCPCGDLHVLQKSSMQADECLWGDAEGGECLG